MNKIEGEMMFAAGFVISIVIICAVATLIALALYNFFLIVS